MAMKEAERYSSLWQSCDELRGGMDASQYKDYVLVLLFVKYVSDKCAGVPFAPITIPKGASFNAMAALKGLAAVVDGRGRRQVVRNGHLAEWTVLTGAGPFEVRQLRARDRRGASQPDAIRFTSAILPPYLRRSRSQNDLIPCLCRRGISTGDYQEALQSLFGEGAASLSLTTITRPSASREEEHAGRARRDLRRKEYVYQYADGVHIPIRLTGAKHILRLLADFTYVDGIEQERDAA